MLGEDRRLQVDSTRCAYVPAPETMDEAKRSILLVLEIPVDLKPQSVLNLPGYVPCRDVLVMEENHT